MDWSFELEIAEGDAPLYVRIADAIRRDIGRGRLRAGQKLPGARTLAASLGVHRNTVTTAFEELEQQGWVRTEPGRGRFVVEVPTRGGVGVGFGRERVPARAAFPVAPAPPRPAARPPLRYDLAGGIPDPREVPRDQLGRAYRRASRKTRGFEYGPPEGDPRLREALARMLADTRGLAAQASDVVVTRGSQHAIWLVMRALLEPGDRVAVEALGYPPAWDAFRAGGAVLRPIPVDHEGIDVDRLAARCERERIRLVYVTPHHQYPTTVTLSARRRAALLALAKRHRFAILEDDYDHELHYEGRPILPIASQDTAGSVVYVGTLSKVLAPGLRLGYVVAPPKVVERVAAWRQLMDRQGDLVVEAAVAELMEEGELQRHAFRMRKIYLARRTAMLDAITRELPGRLRIRVPRGGLSVWAHAPGIDVDAWQRAAAAQGVAIRTARDCAFDGRSRPYLRLVFARGREGELRTAIRRLARALPAPKRTQRSRRARKGTPRNA